MEKQDIDEERKMIIKGMNNKIKIVKRAYNEKRKEFNLNVF